MRQIKLIVRYCAYCEVVFSQRTSGEGRKYCCDKCRNAAKKKRALIAQLREEAHHPLCECDECILAKGGEA